MSGSLTDQLSPLLAIDFSANAQATGGIEGGLWQAPGPNCELYGLGAGVGRGLGVGSDRGVGVGLGVAVAVGVGVAVAVGVDVAVGVGVGPCVVVRRIAPKLPTAVAAFI